VRKIPSMLRWLRMKLRQDSGDSLLALLIRAHEVDCLDGDIRAAWRQGYQVGFENGERHGKETS